MPAPKRKPPVPPEPDPEPNGTEEAAPVPPEPDPVPVEEEGDDKITLVNPTTSAVIYSEDGRQLGGGESVQVDEVDEVGKTAIERGYLTQR